MNWKDAVGSMMKDRETLGKIINSLLFDHLFRLERKETKL